MPEGQWKNLGVDNLLSSAPHIFMNYLSSLKLYFGDNPNCLDKYIPEIVALQDQIRDLESEVSREFLLNENNKDKVRKIFNKLLGRKNENESTKINLAYIVRKCNSEKH